jgi:general secretion pathway protein B
MSLILEALNRSAKERQADSNNPVLDTPAYVDELDRNRKWLAVLPWVAIFIALLVISWLLVDKFTAEQTPAPVAVVLDEKQTRSLVKPPPVREVPPPKREEIGVIKPEELVPADAVFSDPAVDALYAEQAPSGEVVPIPTPQPAQHTEDAENKEELLVERSERAIDIEEVLAKTEEALKTSRLADHPAPFIADVSQQFKDDIPTMMYRHHDYSTKPGESYVILNGQTLRVGDMVSGGVKLEEILPDSIVLDFRGQQFRLRALNSWVNF